MAKQAAVVVAALAVGAATRARGADEHPAMVAVTLSGMATSGDAAVLHLHVCGDRCRSGWATVNGWFCEVREPDFRIAEGRLRGHASLVFEATTYALRIDADVRANVVDGRVKMRLGDKDIGQGAFTGSAVPVAEHVDAEDALWVLELADGLGNGSPLTLRLNRAGGAFTDAYGGGGAHEANASGLTFADGKLAGKVKVRLKLSLRAPGRVGWASVAPGAPREFRNGRPEAWNTIAYVGATGIAPAAKGMHGSHL